MWLALSTERAICLARDADFHGNLFMDAKVSQMTTGYNRSPQTDPISLFRKKGHTVIPIKIGGSRNNPAFGLDTKRVFHSDEKEKDKKSD